jgi:hypothetical protein
MGPKDPHKLNDKNEATQGDDLIVGINENQAITNIIIGHLGQNKPKCYFQPNIPSEIMVKAKQEYSEFLKRDQEILFIYDDSRKLFQYSPGFVFTRKGFGFKKWGYGFPLYIKYNKLNPDHITTRFGRMKIHGRVVRTGKISNKKVSLALRDIIIFKSKIKDKKIEKREIPKDFKTIDTKSRSKAIHVLFKEALPTMPSITKKEIRKICGEHLNYEVDFGDRHKIDSETKIKSIIGQNMETVSHLLYSGQQVLEFQVSIQKDLKFACLSIVVGDASGAPGYMLGARLWKTSDQVFVLGWEGFRF